MTTTNATNEKTTQPPSAEDTSGEVVLLNFAKFSSVSGSQTSHKSSCSSKATKVRARAHELKAEEILSENEFKANLELKRNIQRAEEEAELAHFQFAQGRLIREAKYKAEILRAEASVLEDPESLKNRLKDFDDVVNPDVQPTVQTLPPTSGELIGKLPTVTEVVANNNFDSKPKPLFISTSKPLFSSTPNNPFNKESVVTFTDTNPVYSGAPVATPNPKSWISQMPPSSDPDTGNVVYTYPPRNSLTKLSLDKYDGNPLRWND